MEGMHKLFMFLSLIWKLLIETGGADVHKSGFKVSWKAQKDGLTRCKRIKREELVGVRCQTGHAKPRDSSKKGEVKHTTESLEIINKKAQKIKRNKKTCVWGSCWDSDSWRMEMWNKWVPCSTW